MFERAVADWLASVSERDFEIPFAQLLGLEGYAVLHIARPHGPMEQGKDILALDSTGWPCAFQLKSGDLSLKDWRDPAQPLKGQVEDLLDLPIAHPSIPAGAAHSSFLVTTGTLDDTLRQTIDTFNVGRQAAGKSVLQVWVKGQLQQKITKAFEHFAPTDLRKIRDFLQLVLADGRGLPDRPRVASLLQGQVSHLDTDTPARQLRESCAELVLIGAHLASSYQRAANAIGEMHIWTLVAATLIGVASVSEEAKRTAFRSLGLVEVAIWTALQQLVNEIETRKDYIEGDPFIDAYVYRVRITEVMGFIAAAFLWEKWLTGESTSGKAFKAFQESTKQTMILWGEGAVPSFLAMGWALDLLSCRWEMEGAATAIIQAISKLNGEKVKYSETKSRETITNGIESEDSRGLPNPYVPVIEVLGMGAGKMPSRVHVEYTGQSYALESVVKILVSRSLRQHLTALWPDISRVAFSTYVPAKSSDLWRWHNTQTGFLQTKYVPQPTSWAELQREVKTLDAQLDPPFSKELPHFLLLLLLVAPQRMNPTTVMTLEKTPWIGGRWLVDSVS